MTSLTDLLPLLIPLVAIVGGLSLPILYIVTHYRKRQRLLEQNHRERMLALERGIELPPLPMELLTADPFENRVARFWSSSPERQLRSGLFWLLTGLALGVILWMEPDGRPVWALLPIAVGVAKLLGRALSAKK